MKFERRILSLDVYGEEYKLSFPSTKQIQAMSKKNMDDEKESLAVICALLEECGLPIEVAESMELDHLTQVIAALVPQEKK